MTKSCHDLNNAMWSRPNASPTLIDFTIYAFGQKETARILFETLGYLAPTID
jgi:hypothetical protein